SAWSSESSTAVPGFGFRRFVPRYLRDLNVALFFAHHALQVSAEPLDSCVISLSALLIAGINSWARLAGLSSLRTVTLDVPLVVGAVKSTPPPGDFWIFSSFVSRAIRGSMEEALPTCPAAWIADLATAISFS